MMKKQLTNPHEYLATQDEILAQVIRLGHVPNYEIRKNHFQSLVQEIINQQLSDKAAATITKRFTALFDEGDFPRAEKILALSDEKIRTSGISYPKISYIKNLAQKIVADEIKFDQFASLSDEAVIEVLTQVKGIGQWTAEMFLMFSLGRPDVFSYGDQGLKNAIRKLYNLKSHPTPKQAEKISKKWKPYRSLACRYLWRSLDI